MEDYKEHYSVLLNECLEYLLPEQLSEEKRIADLTFGAGGHSFALLRKDPLCHIYATDQDPDALKNGKDKIKENGFEKRIELVDTNFEKFPEVYPYPHVDGILMDLGVSSHHFDSAERGFSFRFDGPLDMRMDADNDDIPTAADLVNTLDEEELADIIFNFGEDRYAKRIASAIVEQRAQEPIKYTKQLENLVFHCYPKRERFKRAHPATRTFQALRLQVNRELEVLENVIESNFKLLSKGARMCIISFHSLEDRIVKRSFKNLKATLNANILTKRPLTPTARELDENIRSRSAKLRVIEK